MRHDPRSLFEEICEVVLSHADAESDRMQSFLRKAAASAGLNRVHILDKTHTAASIALSANKDVTLAVRALILGIQSLSTFLQSGWINCPAL